MTSSSLVDDQIPTTDTIRATRAVSAEDRWAVGRAEELATAVIAERTRTRVWLHDTVLQTLEYLAAGGYRDDPDPARLMQVAAEAADELRRVVEGEAITSPGGLADGLRAAVSAENARAAHEVRLRVLADDGSVAGPGTAAIAAAVAELLTNARKHARATRVVVDCEIRAGRATVEVCDDGIGFDPAKIERGFGLRNSVAARMTEHGGEMVIRARPGEGTRIKLTLNQRRS